MSINPPDERHDEMNAKSKTMKVLATLTAAGALTVGGATAAMAADGSPVAGSGGTATAEARHSRALGHGVRTAFAAAASTLGLTPEELKAKVMDGPQSIASVAGDQTDAVKAAMVAAVSAEIDQAVANGNFPADRADQAKSRLPQLAERMVNRVPGQHAQQ